MPAQDRPSTFYAPLPPITPASYGITPSFRAQQSRLPTWRKLLKLAPVIFVLGLLLYPYIPFVYLLSYHATYTQRGRPRHAAYQLVTYHALLGLTLWSYFEAWSTPPGSPLEDDIGERVAKGDEEHGIGLMDMLNGEAGRAGQREGLLTHQDDRRPVDSDEAGGAEGRTVMVKSTNGGKRFCRKCSVLKPDRTHHCSTCGCCVLKMDHHCVWLGSCIGQKNYRSFLLFLTYTSLYSVLVGVEAFRTVWAFFEESDAMTEVDFTPVSHLILVIMGFAFSLSIGGFAIYHWWLACHNETTLESMISTRTPPSLALPDDAAGTTAMRWRPDHLLTRTERRAAGSSNINIWDLGWKRNLLSLAPDPPRRRWSSRVPFLVWFMLPSPVAASGLAFTPDAAKVSRLRARTRAIRLGEDMHSLERQRERDDDDRWGMAPEEEGTADEDEDERDGQGAGWETRSSRRE